MGPPQTNQKPPKKNWDRRKKQVHKEKAWSRHQVFFGAPGRRLESRGWSLDRQMGACCTVPVGMVLAAEEKAIDQEVDRFVKDVQ